MATIQNNADPLQRGLLLPFEAGVGAAAFQRDTGILIIFDAARPFDLSAVQQDPLTAGVSVQLLPEATILRFPIPRRGMLSMRRLPAGWLIQANASPRPAKPIIPVMEGALLKLPVESPGRTVIIPDPRTGINLLVGTIRDSHDAVSRTRHGSIEIIEQTIQGVVIDPLSDRLELRPENNGFVLSGMAGETQGGAGSAADLEVPGARILTLGTGPVDLLYHHFKIAAAAAAAAPAAARFLPRLLAAEDALALGDGLLASTIANVSVADDAREAASPRARLVIAAAALLQHHPDSSDLLDDPTVAANGEDALWRAVKLAERNPDSAEAARLFAAGLTLLRSYPAPLQAFLLPLAGETLVRGGTDAQAALVDRLPPDDRLAFARALLAKRRGNRPLALAALDRLAVGQDLRVADRAVEAVVAMRKDVLPAEPGKLADILEAHLLDARIGGHEASSRFQLAELRAQAGQWQKALDLLRETAILFPEQGDEVRRRVGLVLRNLSDPALPVGGGKMLDQVAMIEANAELLPVGADGSRISQLLAARLTALGLPERAAPIIQRMMRGTEPGMVKSALGLQLAALDFQQNDLPAVQAALTESDPGNLPPDLAGPRLLMMARAMAGTGQLEQALAIIAPLKSSAALDLKSSLLSQHGDWGGAADALVSLLDQVRRPSDQLDAAEQDLLLRLASAASRSRDKVRIRKVRLVGEGHIPDQGKASLFRLLTSDPALDNDPTKSSSEVANLHHASAVLDGIAR